MQRGTLSGSDLETEELSTCLKTTGEYCGPPPRIAAKTGAHQVEVVLAQTPPTEQEFGSHH